MKRINYINDNISRYRLLTKPGGLSYKDICALKGCGKTTAFKIINAIHEKVASVPGAKVPTQGIVSRKDFCEYMSWDFNEIQSFALSEIAALSSKANLYTYQNGGTYIGDI